jgi:predicted nucleotidyltransferase
MTRRKRIIPPKFALILRQLRQQLAQFYGERLVEVVLYGSQARGDALPDSDIDVLVVLKGEVNPFAEIDRAGDIAANLSLQYNVVISCLYISEQKYYQERSSLLYNVHREGIPL